MDGMTPGGQQNEPLTGAAPGISQVSATLSAGPPLSSSGPLSVATGNSVTFALSVTNTGPSAWLTQADAIAVGTDAASQAAWSPTIDPLPAVVSPQETVLLAVTITAGPSAGPYELTLRVTRSGTAFASATYSLNVPLLLAAAVVGIPHVDSPVSGQVTAVEATFRNAGNTTWSADDPHTPYLASFSGAWWTPLVTVSPAGAPTTAVKPGDIFTSTATVVLPSNYNLLLSTSMRAAGTVFATGGPYTVQLEPASAEQVNGALAADPPAQVTNGTSATFPLSVTNTGTFPWYTVPGLYAVGVDSTSGTTWAPSIGPLPDVVQPGAVASLSVRITAADTYGPQSLTFLATQAGNVFATSPTYTVSIPPPRKNEERDKHKEGDKPKDSDKNAGSLTEKLTDAQGPAPSGGAGAEHAVPEGTARAFIGSDERPRVGSTLYDRTPDDPTPDDRADDDPVR